ncbi:MAG: hypothetical protein ACI38U_02145 [Corynebacterium sp.]|uniref:hypothetical protein n=1 Tax=Corynebacterium sp. TaxID=1720 RepID=UPI003F0D0E40
MKIRTASAVVALSLAAALTACVGSSPEGRDNDDGAVDKAKDKVEEIKDDPEKAKKEANKHADEIKERALREKDNQNYNAYTWLDPGDTLLVEGESGQYDVTIDRFRTVDLTDGEDVVADLGCYDFTAAEVGSVDGPEDGRLRAIEQIFFADYTDPEAPSTRPYLTMLIDDGSDPGEYYADPTGALPGGTTLSVPVDATGEVDVEDVANIVTDDGSEEATDEDQGDLQGNAGASALDDWRSQYGFGKGGDTNDPEGDQEAETVEPFDEGISEVSHSPLSLTQTRCVVISGGVPDDQTSGSSAVNAGGGEAEEVEERPEDIINWLAWWRGPVGAPETDEDVSYGGWQFPLEASDEADE